MMRLHLTLWTVIGLLLLQLTNSQVPSSCCLELPADAEGCKAACEQAWLDSNTEEQLQSLSLVAQACPTQLIEFWQCINNTFTAVSSAEVWSGRTCCDIPISRQCQNACQRARSREELGSACQPGDEFAFFNCLDKQQISARCCGPATDSRCRAVCKTVFISTPSQSQQQLVQQVQEFCNDQVSVCVRNYTRMAPQHNPNEILPCCDHTDSETCKSHCRNALRTLSADEAIMDEISQHCGAPNPIEPLWQCFLQSSTNNLRHQYHYNHRGTIEVTGTDGAKLHCCGKSVTSKCKDLCVKTYGRSWAAHYQKFSDHCGTHPREQQLNICLREVQEPCHLGCDGLSFCSNFNQRPTELFRSCGRDADRAAEDAVLDWLKHSAISLPLYLPNAIPVKDIRSCRPDVWKAVACTLQIKPCNMWSSVLKICKSHCIDLLTSCLDRDKVGAEVSPENICHFVSAGDNEQCMSLTEYTEPSSYEDMEGQIVSPCRSNPCNQSQVCEVNQRKCRHGTSCLPYTCRQGCHMGEVSKFIVPHHSDVRIPIADNLNCYHVCRCGSHGLLHRCKQMECVEPSACYLNSGRIQDHGSIFYLGCNQCACTGGELVCTHRQCPMAPEEGIQYTGLPCNCPTEFAPVCAQNGRTYPTACIARCIGFRADQYKEGACANHDPCSPNPCSLHEQCIVKNKVCISNRESKCKQYHCVNVLDGCNRHERDPVCDTSGEEFTNICLMMERNRQLRHRGHCRSGCVSEGRVCGLDGVTYSSECAAWGAGVPMDYVGKCTSVGRIRDLVSGESECNNLVCPQIPRGAHCRPITPPGACCPVCAGEIRVLYSHIESKLAAEAAGSQPVSVEDILAIFRQKLSTQQCDVFGYLSIEADLVVLVMPITKYPTPMQVEACMGETVNLARLITTKSPTFMSYLHVSSIITANVRLSKTVLPVSASGHQVHSFPSATALCLLTLCCILRQLQR